jgi:transcriptional regulator with XRE-family HTH domain
MANLGASDLAGIRVRQARQRHNWTAKDLADRCAAAGAPQITPTVITNLETRRRKTREISVDEVLVLAHVLDVPPLQLVVPQDESEELEVVPGVNLDGLAAADWIAGVRLDDLGSPEPGAVGPSARWQGSLARTVGREVLRHRHRRNLSAAQLADRTTVLGMPMSRSVLAALEAGKRDSVAVAEVLVLAASLDIAPIELICPAGFDEQVELLPGQMMDPLQAARWVDGELALDVTGPEPVFRTPGAGDQSGTRLAEEHASLLDEVRVHEAEIARCVRDLDVAETAIAMAVAEAADAAAHDESPAFLAEMEAEIAKRRQTAAVARDQLAYRTSVADRYQEAAAQSLRYIRAEMRRRGMLLPPLPPSLKDPADDMDGDAQ